MRPAVEFYGKRLCPSVREPTHTHTHTSSIAVAMKASTALVALLPLVAATVDPAEILASMPECALECVVEGVADNGCSLTDLPCQCEKLTEMKTTMAPCLVRAGCDLGELTGQYNAAAIVGRD